MKKTKKTGNKKVVKKKKTKKSILAREQKIKKIVDQKIDEVDENYFDIICPE